VTYGKWWFMRRGAALAILGLFAVSAYGGYSILVGNYSGSSILGVIPATDPVMALQAWFATGGLYRDATLGALLIAAFYLVVGGRAFCGWVCPLGLLFDFAHWLSKKLGLRKPFAGFLPVTRYYVLGIVLAAPLLSGVALYEFYNPISILGRALLFGGMGVGMASWLVIGALFLYEFAVARAGWCKSLCPLGAFYSILGRASFVRVVAEGPGGGVPKNLGEVCPEPAALSRILNHEPPSGECTLCGACVDRAGDGSLKFQWKPKP